MVRPRFVNVNAMMDALRRIPEILGEYGSAYAHTELVVADHGVGTLMSTFPQISEAYRAFTKLVPRAVPSEDEWSALLPAAAALLQELEKLNLTEPQLRICGEKLEWGTECGAAINPVTGKCPFDGHHV